MDNFWVNIVAVTKFSSESHRIIIGSNVESGRSIAIELDKHFDGFIGFGLLMEFRIIAGLVVNKVFNEATAMIRHLKY